MKSLILKDLYNIAHNAKSMMILLVALAVLIIPQAGPIAYVITSAIMCSMMIITTFVFDDNAKWTKYAMIMPVTKKNIVLSKFVVLIIFSFVGVIVGFFVGIIGGLILNQIHSMLDVVTFSISSLIGFEIAVVLGSIVTVLVFKYGSDNARILTIVAFVVPVIIFLGGYKIMEFLGITISVKMINVLMCIVPFIAIIFVYFMYLISLKIFSKKEF